MLHLAVFSLVWSEQAPSRVMPHARPGSIRATQPISVFLVEARPTAARVIASVVAPIAPSLAITTEPAKPLEPVSRARPEQPVESIAPPSAPDTATVAPAAADAEAASTVAAADLTDPHGNIAMPLAAPGLPPAWGAARNAWGVVRPALLAGNMALAQQAQQAMFHQQAQWSERAQAMARGEYEAVLYRAARQLRPAADCTLLLAGGVPPVASCNDASDQAHVDELTQRLGAVPTGLPPSELHLPFSLQRGADPDTPAQRLDGERS
ncbi:MAG: hypothetical protein AB3X44_09625 [Leptothrix sp. (in: b-proteobacteria)]